MRLRSRAARILSFALLLALVACGSSAPPVGPSHKAAAPAYEASLDDVLGFLPADSEIVLAIDARQIRSSQSWSALAPVFEKELHDDLAELRKGCGFDPLQTVERVSIGLRAPDAEHVAGVVVIHGVGAGTLKCLRARTGSEDDRDVVITHDGGSRRAAWTVIGATLIGQLGAQASHDSLQMILASASPLRTSHAFMAMYDPLDHGASIVAVADGHSHAFDMLATMRPATLAGTLRITDRIELAGYATFADDASAQAVDALLQRSIPQVSAFVEHAESHVAGSRVDVQLSITNAQLQTLLGNF